MGRWWWALGLAAAGATASPASAQIGRSRCADCHFSRPDAPGARHLSDWDQSAHGRNAVGCETCHGGNPDTFELFEAHQGILRSTNPASPVARVNLPVTCGRCHPGPFASFQKSRHHELLRGGSREAPTCVTCHDEVAASLLSPRQLEARCATCHDAGKIAPRPDRAPQGRLMLEEIREARALLKEARSFIRRIRDQQRRTRLEAAAAQAEVPLREATDAGHAFVFDDLQERLAVARRRIALLNEQLANPELP
jgi:hypothetical protein